MAQLIGFAPLVVFCVIARLSLSLALWLAFAMAFSLGIRSFLEAGILRLLDAAGMVLFGLLALYAGFIQRGIEISWVGMILETALLGLAVWSLTARRPFTAEYAGERISPEQWDTPQFARAQYRLTGVWAVAFAAMAAADAQTLFLHAIAPNKTAAIGLAVLAAALIYTWQSGIQIGRRFGKTPY
ncbi:MAG TPA: hypothetical protein VGC27_01790 [Rhizomicrobium sp.]